MLYEVITRSDLVPDGLKTEYSLVFFQLPAVVFLVGGTDNRVGAAAETATRHARAHEIGRVGNDELQRPLDEPVQFRAGNFETVALTLVGTVDDPGRNNFV